jgi:hypothetical protein
MHDVCASRIRRDCPDLRVLGLRTEVQTKIELKSIAFTKKSFDVSFFVKEREREREREHSYLDHRDRNHRRVQIRLNLQDCLCDDQQTKVILTHLKRTKSVRNKF